MKGWTTSHIEELAKQGKMIKLSEDDIQRSCISWFRWQHKDYSKRLFAIPNGGARNIVVARKLKETGTLAGTWDLFLSVPKNGKGGLFIEIKAGKNGLTDSQIDFREANKEDYVFEVCRSLDEFQNAVNNYLRQ